MPEKPFQEKTEPATPKRREEARKKGQVGKSREIPSVAVLAAGVIFLYFEARHLASSMGNLIHRTFLSVPYMKDSDFTVFYFSHHYLGTFLSMIVPMILVLSVVAIVANFAQTGFIWSVEPLAPKASKISPIEGFKRMFSKRSMVEMAKSLGKILVVGWAAFSTIQTNKGRFLELVYQGKAEIMRFMGETSLDVVTRSCYVIAVLAILDFLYQKWEFEQNLKMTKQEVREEFKQTEGDPLIKSRIRSIQREMARRRMMEEVKRADVVITNPEHLSVALAYDALTMGAPTLVAKGANKIAFKIREIAKENLIPLVENKPLAQNLYKFVDIGQEIPPDFYQAAAEILAYVYGLKNRIKNKGQTVKD
jgi:flagellar biosynthetic protein FlhB